jgi:hypothetical protein
MKQVLPAKRRARFASIGGFCGQQLGPGTESLCHTTFTGNTESGKTNNERLLLIQLAFLNQCIYLADRSYQPFREDRKRGVVYSYKPIEAQLAHEPIVDTPTAVTLLKHLYGIVDERRTERRKVQTANAIVPFQDVYLFIDELAAFAGESKEVMQYVGRPVREARQYGVFFVGAVQDLLNQTLSNDNGAIRENFLTNFYGGGDLTTARMVLNLAKGETIDETGLGVKGVTYLRAKGAGIEKIKARTPLSDDQATQLLLLDKPPVEREEVPIVEAEELQETRLSGELEIAFQLFTHGTKTARDVGQVMGIGKDKANNLLNELQTMGMIQR